MNRTQWRHEPFSVSLHCHSLADIGPVLVCVHGLHGEQVAAATRWQVIFTEGGAVYLGTIAPRRGQWEAIAARTETEARRAAPEMPRRAAWLRSVTTERFTQAAAHD